MTLAAIITPTGIVAPTYADILASLQGSFRSIYGSDVYLEPDSQDGQWLAILATAINDCNNATIACYQAFSPLTAQGVGLSTVVQINGIERLTPSNSQVPVDVGGSAGTIVTNGQICDPALNVPWLLPASVEIPPGGTITVTATCSALGSTQASPGTLTKILNPQRGWQTVSNTSDSATPGQPVESDPTLRQRQAVSTSLPALSVKGAILGAIKNIIGVGRATVYENDTSTTDGNGLPPHSISCVVEGGDVQTIGNAIARYKTPGTDTFGSTEVTAIDPVGIMNLIYFYELTDIQIYTLVILTALTGYLSTTATAISASVANWLDNLTIGQDSSWGKLWSPVNLTGDNATTATGLTQAQLDALSATYDVTGTGIYQARADMVVTGGPYPATTTVIGVTNIANYSSGQKIALVLNDGSYLFTTVNGAPSGGNVTMANAIPTGKSAVNGALMYVQGDLIIAFDEASLSTPAETTVVAS